MAKKNVISNLTVQKTHNVIYIGPDIKGIVKSGTSFSSGLSKALKDEIEKKPVIKKLIVPVEEIAKAKYEIKTKGTAMNMFYKNVKEGK